MERESRTADVIALEPTICLKLSASHIKELIYGDPQIAVKLLEETMKRHRGTTQTGLTEKD